MTMQSRMQKITQSLSALQRISLMLQAHHEGREPDAELSRISDPQQKRAFDRYIALLCTSNSALGPRCDAVALVAGDLDFAAAQVRLLLHAAELLEQEHGMKPPRRVRDWHKPGEMEVNEFLRSVAKEMREELLKVLALRWQELRAIELLWEELAEEFGGEDPVDAQFRNKVTAASVQMRSLAQEFNAAGWLQEPEEAVIAEARKAVDDAFERLEPLL